MDEGKMSDTRADDAAELYEVTTIRWRPGDPIRNDTDYVDADIWLRQQWHVSAPDVTWLALGEVNLALRDYRFNRHRRNGA
jgi:hypothetical protein